MVMKGYYAAIAVHLVARVRRVPTSDPVDEPVVPPLPCVFGVFDTYACQLDPRLRRQSWTWMSTRPRLAGYPIALVAIHALPSFCFSHSSKVESLLKAAGFGWMLRADVISLRAKTERLVGMNSFA